MALVVREELLGGDGTQSLVESLRVGIVQSVIEGDAWKGNDWRMNSGAELAGWKAIERAFQQFHLLDVPPDVVLLPEVSVPRTRVPGLKRMCAGIPCIGVVGIDFDTTSPGRVANQGAILLPKGWPNHRPSYNCKQIPFGKTYPSEVEREMMASERPKRSFVSDPTLWLFDASHLGRFGVCLCYDFMDVDRLPLYRGEIQHLFILAYNRDTATFHHLAESLCRTLYCNVVVCNTGYFGGSVAMTPYARHYRRPTYQILGQRLETAQVLEIPVQSIWRAQQSGDVGKPKRKGKKKVNDYDELKALPPGLPDND